MHTVLATTHIFPHNIQEQPVNTQVNSTSEPPCHTVKM